jgi:hypothetical protein
LVGHGLFLSFSETIINGWQWVARCTAFLADLAIRQERAGDGNGWQWVARCTAFLADLAIRQEQAGDPPGAGCGALILGIGECFLKNNHRPPWGQ